MSYDWWKSGKSKGNVNLRPTYIHIVCVHRHGLTLMADYAMVLGVWLLPLQLTSEPR
jgi:hypothetical protein